MTPEQIEALLSQGRAAGFSGLPGVNVRWDGSGPHPATLAQATRLVAFLNSEQVLNAPGDHRGQVIRRDADETNMLALALEDLRTKVYEAEYPALKARQLLNVASDIDTGAESLAYEETDEAGEAEVIGNYSDPVPSVETKGQKKTAVILPIGVGYNYSIQDLRRAAFSGRPLEARKALAARRAFERKIDTMAALGGESVRGIATGICNKTVGTGAGQVRGTAMTAAAWDVTPVAADMLTNLNALVAEYVVDAKEVVPEGLTLAMPTVHYLRAHHTMFTDGKPESVAQRFLANNGFVSALVPWNKLLGVDASGTESRFLILPKDSEVAEIVMPQDFEIFGPFPKNLAFEVLCHGRTAGSLVYMPTKIRYGTGLGVA